MNIDEFKLERYFALHEFKTRYLLSPSDCESLTIQQLLALGNEDERNAWQKLSLGYTESPGSQDLRAAIADLYAGIHPDEILEAVPEEAIFLAMHALLQPGDRVVAIWPAYQSLYALARSIGCEVSPWPIRLGKGGWELDFDHLASLLPGARLLVVNFPHNPTGFLPSQEEYARILAMAQAHGVFVFSDEMYRLLEAEPSDRLPAGCDVGEKVVSLSGLSKAFGLPGLRVGWLATRDRKLLDRCQQIKDYTTICGSAPSEGLGSIALGARETILARCRGIVNRNRVLAREFFTQHADIFEWIEPRAGSTAFPRWLGKISVEEMCSRALAACEVMIVPGSLFDAPGSHFRVGLGRINFPEALHALDTFLEMDRA